MRKYLVLTADNIDTDICVDGPFDLKVIIYEEI